MPLDAPNQMMPYFDEIGDRLWSNNAAVMVGAGFSRNAHSPGLASASFPDWRELGDLFFRKLQGHPPNKEARYLNVLKLAEQVQATFGRPALDDLLRRAIPDLRYDPSTLHSQLLSLPWNDVFTTNYDTLLERARASVTLKHYEVVVKTEDLLYANPPRIVKLHGSFPSPPFVITEEDYRRYPSDHAPFVNTVRQSLLENTLCLIGFSGDDPNFLQWSGWIRDNVGKESAPKIYLIGVFDRLTEADKKLLDRRGIVVVDLSGYSTDHGSALMAFLNYLRERKPRAPDWPMVSTDAQPWALQPDLKQVPDLVAEWRRQRLEYPGWVVIPEDRRRLLWIYTERWLWLLSRMSSGERAKLEAPLDLDLAFELGWRLDRSLVPLTGKLPALLEEVATKYADADLPLPETSGWTRAAVLQAVADLRIWLLRHYREESLDEQWQPVRALLENDIGRLLPEQRAKFRLEEALYALFCFDPAETRRLLVSWRSNDNLPFWEAKRAALMAELGEAAAARAILESSLAAIRQQLNLNPVMEDYTLVSQESVVMLLLWSVQRSMAINVGDPEETTILDELSERWNELTRYKCDPRREIASLSARLRHPPEGRKSESTTHSFDLGFFSKTIHFGNDEEALAAYGLLRMYEDFGMPYRMENTAFVNAPTKSTLLRIRPYSPHWALVNFVRLGNAEAADGLFDREYLAGLSREEVDRLFKIYLPTLERTIAMLNEPDVSTAKDFDLLAKTLPELFSRLCYKCSPTFRERLVDALGGIYSSKRRWFFRDVGRFAQRLFDSMSVEERIRALPKVVDFSVPAGLNEIEVPEFVNPVRLVALPASVRGEALLVSEQKIGELLDQLARAEDREWVKTSLTWLHERGKLNEHQSARFGRLLWDDLATCEVPAVVGYSSFVCVRLPHPEEIDPEPRVKEHLRSSVSERMEDSGLDEALDELRQSTSVISWSKAEALELVTELSGWWDAHKYQLHHRTPMPFGSPAEVTNCTIRKVVYALSAMFQRIPADSGATEGSEALERFLADLEAHGIPAKALEAATLSIISKNREHVLNRVAAAMLDNDQDVAMDALLAAAVLARAMTEENTREHFAPVVVMLVESVQWRHRPALAQRILVLADLIENQPWFLSEQAIAGLLAGLEQLAEETASGVRANDIDGVISIRAAAARLASTLFRHYQESGRDQPEVLEHWQELCSDPDEFSEVKNSWIVAVG